MKSLILCLLVVLCLSGSAFGQYYYGPSYGPVYYPSPYYGPSYYPAPTYYVPSYYPAPYYGQSHYPAPYYGGPRVWVHPKVYVQGEPVRNFLRAITP